MAKRKQRIIISRLYRRGELLNKAGFCIDKEYRDYTLEEFDNVINRPYDAWDNSLPCLAYYPDTKKVKIVEHCSFLKEVSDIEFVLMLQKKKVLRITSIDEQKSA